MGHHVLGGDGVQHDADDDREVPEREHVAGDAASVDALAEDGLDDARYVGEVRPPEGARH